MGLTVVHDIVTRYRGAIRFDSEPGAGTTAHVYLPLAATSLVPADEPARRHAVPGEGRLLLVDDESAICDSLAAFLRSLGYDVQAETSPAAALARFAATPGAFDVVVTDLNMPEHSGSEVTRAVKAARPELPVVVMTGYHELLTAAEAEELGAAFLLSKPFSPVELSRLLHELRGAGRRPPVRPAGARRA